MQVSCSLGFFTQTDKDNSSICKYSIRISIKHHSVFICMKSGDARLFTTLSPLLFLLVQEINLTEVVQVVVFLIRSELYSLLYLRIQILALLM